MARSFDAHRWLRTRTRYGIKFGLERMRALLADLGHPELAAPCLLVAGTNGKGSTTAYLDAGLRAAGLRVGRYTSPHLVRVNERIAVGGRDVTDAQLAHALRRVRDAAEARRRTTGSPQPTFFESLTLAAFLVFQRARVDVAVLEVGLGGRLDATNVADPLVSAIVSIARDHEAWLGETLLRIAREKAGVMRAGRVTVIGDLPPSAVRTVAGEAARVHARLVRAADEVRVDAVRGVRSLQASYGVVPSLPGEHQKGNLAVAVAVLEAARDAGLRFDLGRAVRGMAGARWPGRLQEIPGDPPLLLDGAHNPAAAEALARALATRGPHVLVFAAMADKDVEGMARVLFPSARAVVLTRPRMARAASPAELRRRGGRFARHVETAPGPAAALARARQLALPGDRVVVAGSLFLVGEVLARLRPKR